VSARSARSRRGELLRGVQAVTDTALAHLDVEALVEELLIRIRDQLGVDTATVLLVDPYGQELVATASVGLEAEVAQGVRLPVGQGFAGGIAASGRPRQLDKVEPSSVLNQILVERGVCSVLGVPLIAAGRVLGVLHVGALQPRRFTEEETTFLQVAAERVAIATQARLAQLDRATAVALQRSLLPARHITPPGTCPVRGRASVATGTTASYCRPDTPAWSSVMWPDRGYTPRW
jgi:phosphoserine phosphatase RsbU/P